MPILGSIASQNTKSFLSAYNSIATVTVGAAVSSISFTSIPATYTHLQLRCFTELTSPGILGITVGASSADTGNNYSTHILDGDAGSAYAGAGVSENRLGILYPVQSNFAGAVIDFLDYTNTNKYKTVHSFMGSDNNGGGRIRLATGNWRSASAIGTIVLTPNAGNLKQYSSFALYGIKGA